MNIPEAIQEGAGVTFVNRLDPVDLTRQSTLLESEVIAVAGWARREALREALNTAERWSATTAPVALAIRALVEGVF